MSYICGHPLAGSQTCRQPVADPAKPDCGRHRAAPPQPAMPPPDERGCRMQESAPGVWRCLVHGDNPEWEAAQALGAILPCWVPLPVEKRAELAESSKDPGTLRILAGDPEEWVRWRAAENPNTTVATLTQLARDPERRVRWGVAGNPNTPAPALARLAGDPEEWVRWGVAENSSTPASLLTQLAEDPDQDVALAARKRMSP